MWRGRAGEQLWRWSSSSVRFIVEFTSAGVQDESRTPEKQPTITQKSTATLPRYPSSFLRTLQKMQSSNNAVNVFQSFCCKTLNSDFLHQADATQTLVMNIKEKNSCHPQSLRWWENRLSNLKRLQSDKCADVSNYITWRLKKAPLAGETGPEIQLFQDLMS